MKQKLLTFDFQFYIFKNYDLNQRQISWKNILEKLGFIKQIKIII